MKARQTLFNRIVAAFLLLAAATLPAMGQTERLDELFDKLQDADPTSAPDIEQEIWNEWSKSGSPAMDLLLIRGRKAMEEGDTQAAIEHLTALVDHAPDFAEGWNALATAYYDAGEFGPSIDAIAKTLTLNPRHFGALSGLGMIFEELGDKQRAIAAYKAALEVDPWLQNAKESVERLEAETGGQEL
ncbi:tetratricopeptide repeat protein [Allitabrizicola rongguiensis]|uniref:tetratricopeptide repeat protein n=1 Tax=Alitabrizicola rongguiensis TaxID=2909234 RepID=UPI00387395D5